MLRRGSKAAPSTAEAHSTAEAVPGYSLVIPLGLRVQSSAGDSSADIAVAAVSEVEPVPLVEDIALSGLDRAPLEVRVVPLAPSVVVLIHSEAGRASAKAASRVAMAASDTEALAREDSDLVLSTMVYPSRVALAALGKEASPRETSDLVVSAMVCPSRVAKVASGKEVLPKEASDLVVSVKV